MLITFSGIDCSGKTTQIRLIEKKLVECGSKPFVFWYRPGYSKELDAIRRFARRFFPTALPTSSEQNNRNAIFAKPGISRAWVYIALIDTFIQFNVKLRLLNRNHTHVICDRYMWDAMLDFQFRFPTLQVTDWWISHVLSLTIPKPDRSFLLILSKDEMLRRMDEKQEPFPDSSEIRDMRYFEYIKMKNDKNFIIIDAEESIERVGATVFSHVVNQGQRE